MENKLHWKKTTYLLHLEGKWNNLRSWKLNRETNHKSSQENSIQNFQLPGEYIKAVNHRIRHTTNQLRHALTEDDLHLMIISWSRSTCHILPNFDNVIRRSTREIGREYSPKNSRQRLHVPAYLPSSILGSCCTTKYRLGLRARARASSMTQWPT